jgi:hypothetical protein
MSKIILQTKIAAANEEIAAAEKELDTALRELRVLSQGEKTQITRVVEDAFSRLHVARKALGELAALVTNEKD